MAKLKGLLARIAKAIVSLGNITTDKGVLSWDGEEDLKAGDNVYIEDAEGNRVAAADGDYVTEDGKTIIVVDGKVSEIADPKAEVAPAQEEESKTAQLVETDKGKLEWDNEDEDLKAGDAVYITDEEGNRNPAPDGEYTTEDGKVITVKDGKVESIMDPKAEVDEEGRAQKMQRIRAALSESYDEKYRKIYEAIFALGEYGDFYIVEAGDDFAVIQQWADDGQDKFFRFKVSWNEDGSANVSDPVEVVPAFVTKEERDRADEEFAAIKRELEALKAAPAAKPAHEEFEGAKEVKETGRKGLDRLARIMSA